MPEQTVLLTLTPHPSPIGKGESRQRQGEGKKFLLSLLSHKPGLTFFLAVALSLVLTACGGSQNNTEDAAALSAEVPSPPTATPTALTQTEATPVVVATAPAGPIVTFTISGGIVGFCDTLTVVADGSYTLTICNQPTLVGKLPEGDLTSLQNWLTLIQSFDVTQTDNAGGADSLSATLNFVGQGEIEANDTQRQVLVDWANGLMVRLRPAPQPETAPAAEPAALNPSGLCPTIQRPALILGVTDNPGIAVLMDPASQATCDIIFKQPPFGRIVSAAGYLYYPIFNAETNTVTVWQITPDGNQQPLEFTTITMAQPGPYSYLVSDDGTKIAWTQTIIDDTDEPPLYTNSLWLADIDGGNQVALLDGVENNEVRYASLVRFGTDNALYYALQPNIGGPVFSGRYDTLYTVPANTLQTELVYACPAEENAVCIGGLSADGQVFTIIQPDAAASQHAAAIQLINRAGDTLATLPLPATDYVERTAFAPDGSVAFFSATLTEPTNEEEAPRPDPGYITLLAAPYTGQPQTLLSNSSVATLLGWLDNNRLVYGTIAPDGTIGTALVSRNGQQVEASPDFGLGVLR